MSDEANDLRARPLERFFADRLADADDGADDGFERTSLDGRPVRGGHMSWRPRDRVARTQSDPPVYVEREEGRGQAEPLRRHRGALGRSPWRQAQLGRIAISAALCLLAGLLTLLLDPGLPSALFSAPEAPRAAGPRQVDGPLTAFSDWRAAYIAEDSTLYVVTSDGRTTLLGPRLPEALPGGTDLTREGVLGARAGAAPNGHWIAYLTHDATLALLDLSATPPGTRTLRIPPDTTALFWSPDSARLALATRSGAIVIVGVLGATVARLSTHLAGAGLPELDEARVVGWLDASTLLIAQRNLGLDAATIEAISVARDTVRPVAIVPLAGQVLPRFSLSPTRAQLLAFGDTGPESAHASVTLIDTTTGRVLPLASIERTLDGPVVAATWSPQRPELIALTRSFDPADPAHSSSHLWTFDLASETAVRLRSYGVPLAWAPDAGAPIFASVISETDLPEAAGHNASTAFVLRSRSVAGQNGRPGLRTLAQGRLIFLGFVRTA